jgi:hypothetical protein
MDGIHTFDHIYVLGLAVSVLCPLVVLASLLMVPSENARVGRKLLFAGLLGAASFVSLSVLLVPGFNNQAALFLAVPAINIIVATALAVGKLWRQLLWFTPSILVAVGLWGVVGWFSILLALGLWAPIGW